MIIIGTGTGRCGTTSFANLLEMQDDTTSTHQLCTPGKAAASIDIKNKKGCLDILGQRILNRKTNNLAQTAFYWLNLVDDLIEKYKEEIKIVYIHRSNQEDTIRSFNKKCINMNHWQDHDGSIYHKNVYDLSFPKFNYAKDRDEALLMYLEHCKLLSASFAQKYNNQFKIILTEDLNNIEKMNNVLGWLGYSNPKYNKIIANRS